jgi:hypothetical protein
LHEYNSINDRCIKFINGKVLIDVNFAFRANDKYKCLFFSKSIQ